LWGFDSLTPRHFNNRAFAQIINKGHNMRNLILSLPLLLLAACSDDDKRDEIAECTDDTVTQDTAGDTSVTDPVDTSDTSGSDTADTSDPVDTGAADTGTDTGADTGVPVDTGADTGTADTSSTDTGATDTGTSSDTSAG
jgi:hypothetical protein